MKLAKDCLDIGLLTGDAAMIEFFRDEIGLGEPEELRVTKQVTQHRFDVAGSVVKVNVVPGYASDERKGYRGIALARDGISAAVRHTGPDGIEVDLVPMGDRGVTQLGIRLDVPEMESARRYFADALGWETATEPGGALRASLGRSIVIVEQRDDAPTGIEGPVGGWTYMTVQIHDCDAEIAELVARGVRVSKPAHTMGEVARFGMVVDPFGNELEISQRFSLVGPPKS